MHKEYTIKFLIEDPDNKGTMKVKGDSCEYSGQNVTIYNDKGETIFNSGFVMYVEMKEIK